MKKITSETVRANFNDLQSVVHYTRAAHELGLWASERALIERFFPDKAARLLEAGCGAGRVTIGLWQLGYHALTAFDFAAELVDQARSLAAERRADPVADAAASRRMRSTERRSSSSPRRTPGSNSAPSWVRATARV